jgi:cytosine/uracil/thiamine/allantoin permease
MSGLRPTFVRTPAMKIAVDQSVKQPPTTMSYVTKPTNADVQNMFHHVINYQHVSIVFAIIGVALQEYEEYNNLPHSML